MAHAHARSLPSEQLSITSHRNTPTRDPIRLPQCRKQAEARQQKPARDMYRFVLEDAGRIIGSGARGYICNLRSVVAQLGYVADY